MTDTGQVLVALAVASFLGGLGYLCTRLIPTLKRFRIPGSVVGGLLGLAMVQLSSIILSQSEVTDVKVFTHVLDSLKRFPGMLINIVFAALMLGKPTMKFKESLSLSGPNILMGHAFAWGQHWVGAILALLVFPFFYEKSENLAPLIVIGFQGGHGTAAGLEKTFRALDFPQGVDLGLGMATGGVLIGLISGLILFNFLREDREEEGNPKNSSKENEKKSSKTQESQGYKMISGLTVQSGFIAFTIGLAWLFFQAGEWFEKVLWEESAKGILQYIPLFPIVLLTSLFVNFLFRRVNLFGFLDRTLINRIGTTALDLLIVAAVTTLDLAILADYGLALSFMLVVGVALNLSLFFWLGRQVYPSPWYVYGLPDYGGATATTATGLALADVADPERSTRTQQAYTFKQPFYEPFMGGGLVTALALPLIKYGGLWVYLGVVSLVLIVIGLIAYFWRIRRRV